MMIGFVGLGRPGFPPGGWRAKGKLRAIRGAAWGGDWENQGQIRVGMIGKAAKALAGQGYEFANKSSGCTKCVTRLAKM